ncbi:hypothetical protein EYE40_07245 [Glaciihabitans arcticus]|uniref:Uncharacterized protein n=1 Tax=Glaciihabitans arcticus TaxID=2668039 RepID=A0A4V2JEX1_9MICO|nr:hypothetical protein [Glaciihabitans arcticus]TBN57209.1 hypothetical protein EYE40_07245 [Glaciihabitans arcticus]
MSFQSDRDDARRRAGTPSTLGVRWRPLWYLLLALGLTAFAALIVWFSLLMATIAERGIRGDLNDDQPATLAVWIVGTTLFGWIITLLGPGMLAQTAYAWTFFWRSLQPAFSGEQISADLRYAYRLYLFIPIRRSRWTDFWAVVDRAAWAPNVRIVFAALMVGALLMVALTQFGGLQGTTFFALLVLAWVAGLGLVLAVLGSGVSAQLRKS